jgi:thiol:disulfide interchange protein DsbD
LLSPKLEVLNKTVAYEPSSKTYFNWLRQGLENFENKKR